MTDINPKVGTVIKSLTDYAIVVWEGNDEKGEYGVVNTTYGVMEASTPLLPQALEYLEQLQSGYDARIKDAEEEEVEGDDNVTPIRPKDTLH